MNEQMKEMLKKNKGEKKEISFKGCMADINIKGCEGGRITNNILYSIYKDEYKIYGLLYKMLEEDEKKIKELRNEQRKIQAKEYQKAYRLKKKEERASAPLPWGTLVEIIYSYPQV